jgi:DNA-binding SARP family transcriptional activator
MSDLELRLLGPPLVATPEGPVALARRQPLALLAYLALTRRPAPREQLMLLLFGDCEEGVARQRIRRPLHDLRRALTDAGAPPNLVSASGELVTLDHDRCELDVATFAERASGDASDAEEALKLYRGPLLEGFGLPDSPDFEDWLTRERERLRLLRLDLLGRATRWAALRADWPSVSRLARELLAEDPLLEDAHLRLMEAYAAEGRHSLVLRQWDSLREALRRELDSEPLPQTRARFEALLQGRVARVTPAPRGAREAALPFLGRERELAVIERAGGEAAAGALRTVCVTGPSGIGKSRLAQEALARLDGVRALQGAYYPGSQPAPYEALAQALGDALSEQENPFSRRLSAPEGEQRFWEALARALRKLTRPGPAALVLDDLQWADPALLRALPYLLRRLADAPLLVVLLCRTEDQPEPVSQLLAALDRLPLPPERVELTPLGEPEALELVRAYLRADEDGEEVARELLNETDGNPFYMVQTLRALKDRGHLRSGDGRAIPLPLPASVRVAVEQRVGRLPAAARQVAEIAAVIGREVELDTLRRAGGMAEAALVEAAEALERAGLFERRGEGYRFAHTKVREVLYDRLGPARQRLLHRRVAKALGQSGAPGAAAELLAHAERAHEWALAFGAARRAATQARRLPALADAAAFESRALGALLRLPPDPERRVAVLLDREELYHRQGERDAQAADLDELGRFALETGQLAQSLYRRGRYLNALCRWDEARSALEQALEEATDPELRCTIGLELASCLSRREPSAAVAVGRGALDEAQGPGGAHRRLRAYLALAEIAFLSDDLKALRAWLEQARPLARLSPDAEARLWLRSAQSRLREEDYEQMLLDAERARSAYAALGDVEAQADSLNLLGIAHGRLRRFGEAVGAYEEALALHRAVGKGLGQARAMINLGLLRYRLGDYPAAFKASREGYELCASIGEGPARCSAAISLAIEQTMLGDGPAAEGWARTALELSESLDLPIHRAFGLSTLGAALLRQGRASEALAACAEALALFPTSSATDRADTMTWLAMSSLALGDLAAADEHSAAAVASAEGSAGMVFPQRVGAVRARVLHALGDGEGAAAALGAARRALGEMLRSLPTPEDRRRYEEAIATNRFIAAAERGDWDTFHPLF